MDRKYPLNSKMEWRRDIGKYVLSHKGDRLWCSCPGWKFSAKPTALRICKHMSLYYPDYRVDSGNVPVFVGVPKLPLFTIFDEKKHGSNISEFWWSEKFDGIRAQWNGRQLVTRAGHVIDVPRSWARSHLPRVSENMRLDGELYSPQSLSDALSAVQIGRTCKAWSHIQYKVFDAPSDKLFSKRLLELEALRERFDVVEYAKATSVAALKRRLIRMTRAGREGIVLRHQDSPYHPGRRSQWSLKWKIDMIGAGIIMHQKKHRITIRVILPKSHEGQSLTFAVHDVPTSTEDDSIVTFIYEGISAHGDIADYHF